MSRMQIFIDLHIYNKYNIVYALIHMLFLIEKYYEVDCEIIGDSTQDSI